MNAADLARLDLARRAYKASEPGAPEVQAAVRRARLALRRPGARSLWFSKALVMVVLAIGGLAFAKPHVLRELVEGALPSSASPAPQRAPGSAAVLPPVVEQHPAGVAAGARAVTRSEAAPAAAAAEAPAQANPKSRVAPAPDAEKASAAPAPPAPRQLVASSAPSSAAFAPSDSSSGTVSEWGRVGQALAQGDESRALAVLGHLSESGDPRTRDKANLGRAQLFMANGERDKACSTARSLTNRGAGSRIERQAQALLKSCGR